MTGRTAGRIANAVAAASLLLVIVSSVAPLRGQTSGDSADTGAVPIEGDRLPPSSAPGSDTTVTGRVPVTAGSAS